MGNDVSVVAPNLGGGADDGGGGCGGGFAVSHDGANSEGTAATMGAEGAWLKAVVRAYARQAVVEVEAAQLKAEAEDAGFLEGK